MNRRTFAAAVAGTFLMLELAAAPSGVGAAATGGTLEIRGLQRPPGHQVVALRLSVSPAPTQRTPLTAALTVGGIPVSVPASVGRSGRLVGRQARVDLTSVLPAFGSALLSLPGPAGAVVTFDASACLPRSNGRTLRCTPSGGTAAPPDGVYDAVAHGRPVSVAWLATAADGDRTVDVVLDHFDSLSLSGAQTGVALPLAGWTVFDSDMVGEATGSAFVDREADAWRLDGSATSPTFGVTYPFVLRRHDGGTPAELGGSWRFTFDGTPPLTAAEAVVELAVPGDGHATTGPSTVTVDGAPVYMLTNGTCAVAPSGATWCILPTAGSVPFRVLGTLDAATGTGSGSFYLGQPYFHLNAGAWSATKAP